MAQSYKVFIGSSFVQFGNAREDKVIFNRKLTDPGDDELMSMIEEMEGKTELKVSVSGNFEEAWARFCSNFKVVEAAGGLVGNENGEWLFIHRNGMWDLPKGKLEKEEIIEKCAVREVAEECGIIEPSIIRPLNTTFHTYQLKGQRILKPTYWFLMKSSDARPLKAQMEEGISDVKWVSTAEAKRLASGSFGSILQVVTDGLLAAH